MWRYRVLVAIDVPDGSVGFPSIAFGSGASGWDPSVPC
jgi:hypothetical protein